MNHPWCSDIERDLAVRAAEDAVPRPALPEWSELPKRVAALEAAVVQLQQHDPSPASRPAEAPQTGRPGGGTDPSSSRGERGEDGNGLRTERVTLEVTYCGAQSVSASVWDWPYMLANYIFRDRESVRVVTDHERDAEIERAWRYRDEWQAGCIDAEKARDEARARVAELEAKVCAQRGTEAMHRAEVFDVQEAWLDCGIEQDWPDDEPGTPTHHAHSMAREIKRLRARVAGLEAGTESQPESPATEETSQSGKPVAWRNASNHPPELGEMVLCRWVVNVCGNRQVSYGEASRRPDGMYGKANRVEMIPPTHWRPLPAGPSEGRDHWETDPASSRELQPLLTAEEREAVEASREFWQSAADCALGDENDRRYADTLGGLLKRAGGG